MLNVEVDLLSLQGMVRKGANANLWTDRGSMHVDECISCLSRCWCREGWLFCTYIRSFIKRLLHKI